MTKIFTRALSIRPIIVTREGREVLDKRVVDVLDKLREKGKDPLDQLRACQEYLQIQISKLKRTHDPKSWIIKNKNPRVAGSRAWYEYMLVNTTNIVGFLIAEKMAKMIEAAQGPSLL